MGRFASPLSDATRRLFWEQSVNLVTYGDCLIAQHWASLTGGRAHTGCVTQVEGRCVGWCRVRRALRSLSSLGLYSPVRGNERSTHHGIETRVLAFLDARRRNLLPEGRTLFLARDTTHTTCVVNLD